MKIKHIFTILSFISATITLTGCNGNNKPKHRDEAKIAAYYEGIDGDSNRLLNDLNSLNNRMRVKMVGYTQMLSAPAKGFYVTDPGDTPNSIRTFYSGRSHKGTSGLNREHVWPAAKMVAGRGDELENDINVIRPTLTDENGSRGCSFYVQGMCTEFNGWDPAMEDFGDESYRGDAARIIFYCCIADTRLKLVDKNSDTNSNHTMGKLSDLLKWNLEYPVTDREYIRNEGSQQLQGNRNPFIDHSEYACKIWGNTNASTRRICGLN